MRYAHRDPELLELVHRYVTPDRRYLKLGGSLLRLTKPERVQFTRKLGEAANEITPTSWASCSTADGASARPRPGSSPLPTEPSSANASANSCSPAKSAMRVRATASPLPTSAPKPTASLLAAYLDRYLRRPDLYYDQAPALGALLHLDMKLGADHAARFLAPAGLWQQWIDGPPSKQHHDPHDYTEIIGQFCTITEESARYCKAQDQEP